MPPSGTAALVARSAGELALLGATFFAAGRRAAGRLSFESAGEEIGVSLALGAGICGTALFLLAAAGGLTRAAVIALAAGIHAIALPVWRDVAARVRHGCNPGFGADGSRPRSTFRFTISFASP